MLNKCPYSGIFFYVTGSLKARHLVAGGGKISIDGSLELEEVLWAHSNYGVLQVGGSVKSPIVIEDDFYRSAYGNIDSEHLRYRDRGMRSNVDIRSESDGEKFTNSLRKLLSNNVKVWDDFFLEVCAAYNVLRATAKKRSYEDWLAIVKQDAERIRSVPEKLCDSLLLEAAISSSSFALQYVPERLKSPELCYNALVGAKDGRVIQYIPEKYHTKELWLEALKLNMDYEMIPELYRNDDFLVPFLKHNPNEIDYIEEEDLSQEMVLAVISGQKQKFLPGAFMNEKTALVALERGVSVFGNLPYALITESVYKQAKEKFSSEPEWNELEQEHGANAYICWSNFSQIWEVFLTEEVCLEALENDIDIELRELPVRFRTKKICKAALKKDIDNFPYIPKEHLTKRMCTKAVNSSDRNYLEFVPEKFHSNDLYIDAVVSSGENLEFVPEQKRSLTLCMLAINDSLDAINFIPSHIQEKAITKKIETSLSQEDHAELYIERADARLKNEEYEGAIKDAEFAIKEYDCSDSRAHFILAKAHLNLGDKDSSDLHAVAVLEHEDSFLEDLEEVNEDICWLEEAAKCGSKLLASSTGESFVVKYPVLFKSLSEKQQTSDLAEAVFSYSRRRVLYIPRHLLSDEMFLLGVEEELFDLDEIPLKLHEEARGIIAKIEDEDEDEDDCGPNFDYEKFSFKKIFLKAFFSSAMTPVLKSNASKGLTKYLVERPIVATVTNVFVNLLILIPHLYVSYYAWKEASSSV